VRPRRNEGESPPRARLATETRTRTGDAMVASVYRLRPGTLRAVELLTTPEILALHERLFGRLDPRTKQRIVQAARNRGWDRRSDAEDQAVA
jgi:hypothetical protein